MRASSSIIPTSVIVAAAASPSGFEVSEARPSQPLNLAANDFEIFQLPERYCIDVKALEHSWKALQKQAHPDMHAQADQAAQRLSMQWSVRVNEAYQRLKNPMKRAAYLCELKGQSIDAETNTAMPNEFLLQQMEWRETLEAAETSSQAEDLLQDVRSMKNALLAEFEQILDVQNDLKLAAQKVRALMFVERFIQAVMHRIDQLDRA